ncbi:hypothetical protein FQN50_007635 [Emmonsiellopsis sp. PD_5]|nr:hypothetical protein FQN50_007635 [Emmonsiellopsis sp. PD_5]
MATAVLRTPILSCCGYGARCPPASPLPGSTASLAPQALSGDESAALPPNPGVHSTLADTARRSNEAFEFITSKDEASRRKARSHVMRDFMRRKRSRNGQPPLDQGEIGSPLPSSNMTGMQFKWKPAPKKRGASSRNVRFMASKGHASAQGEESAVDSPADPPIRPLSQPGFQQTSRGNGQQNPNVAEFPELRGRQAASHFKPFPSHMWKVDFDDYRLMHHCQHRIIERLVYWVDYTTAPNPSIPCSFPWLASPYLDTNISYAENFMNKGSRALPSDNSQSIQANTNTGTSTRTDPLRPDLIQYILSTCDELLSFMQHMCWLTIQTSMQSKSLNPPAAILYRAATFKIGSPLHSLLSSPSPATMTPTNTNISNSAIIESRNIATDYARMSCLLYLNLALWDFRNDPTGLSRFLTCLSSQLQPPEQQQRQQRQPLDPSQTENHGNILTPESLLWICLLADNLQFGTNEIQCSQRLWFTGRLLRTIKRVDKVVFQHIQELLVGFLALDVPVDGNQMLLWEVEKVRESVLGGLYGRA